MTGGMTGKRMTERCARVRRQHGQRHTGVIHHRMWDLSDNQFSIARI